MGVFLLILGLVLFVGLVVVHELGHFWAAKKGGVDVEEFGIFFPPRLFKKRMKGGWDFTINALPLGGFVKLKGEHDSDTEPGSFGAASLKTKSVIMAAGVAMNLAIAYVLFVVLAVVGMPHIIENQFTVASDTKYTQLASYVVAIDAVEKDSPAAKAGLAVGDTIEAIGLPGKLQTLTTSESLNKFTQANAGKTVAVRVTHKGTEQVKAVALRSVAQVEAAKKQGKTVGKLGVSYYPSSATLAVTRSTWSAPIVAGGVIGQFTALTFQGLGKALAGLAGTIAGAVTGNTAARQAAQTEGSSQVSGPVGIFFVFKYGAELGLLFIFMIVALLSLTLAIMNILPIPALDGGRLWITLIAHGLKRPLTAKQEEVINASGFLLLMGLIVLITFVDIQRFF
jgi:regulator of sigma E protease